MKQYNNSLNSKQVQRKENKKRKMSALYMISSLNEEEKKKTLLRSLESEKNLNLIEHVNPELNNISDSKKRKYEHFEGGDECEKEFNSRKQLSDEELQKLRLLIRQRFAAKKNIPKLRLKEPGIQATIDHPKENRIPLFLSDVQHLILYGLHGHMSTGNIPRWIAIEKFSRIKNVLFLIVEGMSLSDYKKFENQCPTLYKFQFKMEVITPLAYGGCLIREIATVPLTESQKCKLEKRFGSTEEAAASVAACKQNKVFKVLRTMFPMGFLKRSNQILNSTGCKERFSRTELLLSPWQMLEENYPLPLEGELKVKYADFVYTKDTYKEVTSNSPLWALDCEMCTTCLGSEVTRVSIVNENLQVMYESFVKPYNPITDYLTRFSGITPNDLENVWTRLEDVQNTLREIIPPDVILVGHSLNSDLSTLKMFHPYCIDTSVIFNLSGERARKTKLKVLAAEFLGERIQHSVSKGHDSIEDASACMKLVQLKLKHSIEWGDAVICGRQYVENLLAKNRIKFRSKLAAAADAGVGFEMKKTNRKQAIQTQPADDKPTTTSNLPNLGLKGNRAIPSYVHGENVVQIQMLTTSLFHHLLKREKKCLLVTRHAEANEFRKYIPDNILNTKSEPRFEINEQETNKAIVKFGRNKAPDGGASIMYAAVERTPELTALKVDHLTEKLIKDLSGNVLVVVLLAGRSTGFDEVDPSNHGLLLLQLHQQLVPPITLDSENRQHLTTTTITTHCSFDHHHLQS